MFFVGIMYLFYHVPIEVMCFDLMLQVITCRKKIQTSIKRPYLFIIFLLEFGLHLE
jgi:hypothetical protein